MDSGMTVEPAGPRRNWLRRTFDAIGEISLLRSTAVATSATVGSLGSQYTLDSTKVDYVLARQLYQNTHDRYKLGGGFARPIINATAGFMGPPHFDHETDPDAADELAKMSERWAGKFFRVNRNTLRDGDCFVRMGRKPNRFRKEQEDFDLQLLPPEWVTVANDPVTGEWHSVTIAHPTTAVISDSFGNQRVVSFTLNEILTEKERTIQASDDAPEDVKRQYPGKKETNQWGFIPVVHFKNEAEEGSMYGSSDLEPVEPFLRAYHDVKIAAVAGSRLFSRPKAAFKVKDVDRFMKRNFPNTAPGEAVRFDNKEIFIMADTDNAQFITASAPDITTLLKFIFFCIVDVSETPEFAFGTAVQSSKASVQEQMTPLSRKIRRKRGMFEDAYLELGSMYLAMWSKVNNKKLETFDVQVGWEEISPKDPQQVASTIQTLAAGLKIATVDAGLISQESASEFLRTYIPTMLPWHDEDGDDDELRRIGKMLSVLRSMQEAKTPPKPEPKGAAAGAKQPALPPGTEDAAKGAADILAAAADKAKQQPAQPDSSATRRRRTTGQQRPAGGRPMGEADSVADFFEMEDE